MHIVYKYSITALGYEFVPCNISSFLGSSLHVVSNERSCCRPAIQPLCWWNVSRGFVVAHRNTPQWACSCLLTMQFTFRAWKVTRTSTATLTTTSTMLIWRGWRLKARSERRATTATSQTVAAVSDWPVMTDVRNPWWLQETRRFDRGLLCLVSPSRWVV